MVATALRSTFAALMLAAGLAAHGGQYRGPLPSTVPPGMPLLPTPRLPTAVPVPTPTPRPGPTTGVGDLTASTVTWQIWWEFNKEPYLRSRIQGRTAPVTGSDDFYLGTRQASLVVDVLQPTDADLSDRIVPALANLLEADGNRDIQSACLMALGKVARDGPGVDLEQVLASRLARDNQEVRETAALALGVAGRRAALPLLRSLACDDRQGRKLEDRSQVRDRTRAFAAYGLGMLARRLGDPEVSQQVHDVLWPLLNDRNVHDQDLRAAAVTALGVLRADPERSADKRLAWQTVAELREWFERDDGAGAERVQAHAPIAIARLLGRGTTPEHQRSKELFAKTLNSKKRRGAPILQSCAIALGMLAVDAEQHVGDAAFSAALQEHYERGHDQVTRSFCVMSLGRIGGAANRELLLRYAQRNRTDQRPWLALALGILAESRAARGEVDVELAELLLADLEESSTDDERSALAVAVGLTGHGAAVPGLLRQLKRHERDERVAGYLCIGLGLLRDPAAVSPLTAIMERSERRPFLLQQCAVALGCLGDRQANDHLTAMLDKADSVAVLAAIATGIGRIGDRRAIDPLIEMTTDRGLTKLARAFVAAALGGVGDKDELPWNVPLSVDSNFATQIDTLSNGATGVLDIL